MRFLLIEIIITTPICIDWSAKSWMVSGRFSIFCTQSMCVYVNCDVMNVDFQYAQILLMSIIWFLLKWVNLSSFRWWINRKSHNTFMYSSEEDWKKTQRNNKQSAMPVLEKDVYTLVWCEWSYSEGDKLARMCQRVMTLVKCFSLECPNMVHILQITLKSLDNCLFLVGLRHSLQFFSCSLFTFTLDSHTKNKKKKKDPSSYKMNYC